MKKRFKYLSIVGFIILAMSLFAGCDYTPSSDEKQQTEQEQMLQQATDQLGMPNIANFQEKKLMKQIMELCDKSDLICYVYTFSEYTGLYNYMGKCVGFGLPYGTEYTSPEKATYHNGGYATLPQADPNGLFKPADVQATWICMIDEQGNKYILYNEPNIAISSHKLPKTILNKVPDGYDDLK